MRELRPSRLSIGGFLSSDCLWEWQLLITLDHLLPTLVRNGMLLLQVDIKLGKDVDRVARVAVEELMIIHILDERWTITS